MAVGSRPVSMPTTACASPSTENSSIRARASTIMPATLWAPSTTTSGWRPTTSSRPGTRTAANASSTTSSARGDPKNASTAASAHDALSPWWAPCNGTSSSP